MGQCQAIGTKHRHSLRTAISNEGALFFHHFAIFSIGLGAVPCGRPQGRETANIQKWQDGKL